PGLVFARRILARNAWLYGFFDPAPELCARCNLRQKRSGSIRISGAPSLEQRMDDLRAIMDAIGSRRGVLLGFSEGCPLSVLFAATYPERVSHLILFGGFARGADRVSDDVWPSYFERILKNWGTGETIKTLSRSQAANPDAIAQFAKFERLSTSPGALRTV